MASDAAVALGEGAKDLRSGLTLWERRNGPTTESDRDLLRELSVDVVIVGCGISGAFLAERLTRNGKTVAILDRRGPQRGSTSASTSLLQWELDAPLLELESRLGFEAASRIYRRSIAAVAGIAELVAAYGIACGLRRRGSLYLAGSELDPYGLREEHQIRNAAGILGEYLSIDELMARKIMVADAALFYGGSAVADPIALANGLLFVARSRGASIMTPVTALAYDRSSDCVSVVTDRSATVHARALVLATGYEMPAFVPSSIHRIVSTWVMATAPLPSRSLPHDLFWQASDPYLYARTTNDRRIIAGGEDEPITNADARDALTKAKTAAISSKIQAILPALEPGEPEFCWSGFFGETIDGLPLIGRVPGMPDCYAAFGYGGNGISSSFIAAEMIDRMIRGDRDQDEELLAIDRTVE